MWFYSELAGMNCRLISIGFSSGHFAGSGGWVISARMTRPAEACRPASSSNRAAWAPGAAAAGIRAEVQRHACGVAARQHERCVLARVALEAIRPYHHRLKRSRDWQRISNFDRPVSRISNGRRLPSSLDCKPPDRVYVNRPLRLANARGCAVEPSHHSRQEESRPGSRAITLTPKTRE
jgi:hypothetical protein